MDEVNGRFLLTADHGNAGEAAARAGVLCFAFC